MTTSPRWARSGVVQDLPAAFHAPLFRELVTGISGSQRRVVLDLGQASTPMLALLGRGRCRVEVADLAHFGGLDRLNTARPGRDLAGVANSLFPYRRSNDMLELVLCWDLLNYLTLDALAALMKVIAGYAAPRALVHALIYYAECNMPQHPGRFAPNEKAYLINHATDLASIPAPRYSSEDLSLNMGDFAIDRARLLSNGMQEYLFQLKE